MDVLIITALQMEFDAARSAALAPTSDASGVREWQQREVGKPALPYLVGRYERPDGRAMEVGLARPAAMGGLNTGVVASALTDRLKPACLAMCGVCAGNPAVVALGDVVVAELAYTYDEGQRTTQGFVGDHRQVLLNERWVRAAQELAVEDLPSYGAATPDEARIWFLERVLAGQEPRDHPARRRYFPRGTWPEWLTPLEADGHIVRSDDRWTLTPDGRAFIRRRLYDDVDGPPRLPFSVVTAPMASGSVVVKDGITWDQLQMMGVRKIAGLEMEAAAVATIAHQHQIHWLVAKGVMDYADPNKDDRYKKFAARAAAEVLYALLAKLMSAEEGTIQAPALVPEPKRSGDGDLRELIFHGEDMLRRLDAELALSEHERRSYPDDERVPIIEEQMWRAEVVRTIREMSGEYGMARFNAIQEQLSRDIERHEDTELERWTRCHRRIVSYLKELQDRPRPDH